MRKLALACIVLCGLAAPGIAADVPVFAPYEPPPLLRPLYSWTGCRIGVNIGGGAAPQTFTDTAGTFSAPPGLSLGPHTARGVAGGGQIGCDYQAGPFVFGIQGFYDLTGMKANNLQPNGFFLNNSFLQSVATLTGRVGYTVTPTVLLYAKAGAAWVHDRYNVATPTGLALNLCPGTMMLGPICAGGVPPVLVGPGTFLALGDPTETGWTAGVGAESALFGSNWSVFLEYNYMNFGTTSVIFRSATAPGLTFPLDIRQSVNVVLFGLNYRFYGGAPWL